MQALLICESVILFISFQEIILYKIIAFLLLPRLKFRVDTVFRALSLLHCPVMPWISYNGNLPGYIVLSFILISLIFSLKWTSPILFHEQETTRVIFLKGKSD